MRKLLFFSLLLALLGTSCTDVIEIDLDEADAKTVIEAIITDQPGPYTVRITRSVPFDQSNIYPGVNGAVVTINDGAVTDTLVAGSTDGVYTTTTRLAQAQPGRTYQLKVVLPDGAVHESTSTMQPKVPFDSLQQSQITGPGTGDLLVPIPVYTDWAGVSNYYKWNIWHNGAYVQEINVSDDRNFDGRRVTRPLISPQQDYAAGDTLLMEMQCIDRSVYKYFVSLTGVTGPGSAPIPGNPESNITGGAAGYFSAHTVERKTMVFK
jgi:Domain of unknown function (DUF4249)